MWFLSQHSQTLGLVGPTLLSYSSSPWLNVIWWVTLRRRAKSVLRNPGESGDRYLILYVTQNNIPFPFLDWFLSHFVYLRLQCTYSPKAMPFRDASFMAALCSCTRCHSTASSCRCCRRFTDSDHLGRPLQAGYSALRPQLARQRRRFAGHRFQSSPPR